MAASSASRTIKGRPPRFLSAPIHNLSPMTSPTAALLDELIESATVDCYNDSEQVCGLFTMLDDALTVPFETIVLGATVTVTAIDLTVDDQIVAICTRGTSTQRIALLDLPIADPPPPGAEWIEAYRRWSTQQAGA
jgi:hypothetical protein